jgi:predicted DNA-binding transcriptional regulator AlpA
MKLVTVREACDVLRVTPARAYQLIRENHFPPGVIIRLGERQLRFSDVGLRSWIESGGNRTNDNGSNSATQAVGTKDIDHECA